MRKYLVITDDDGISYWYNPDDDTVRIMLGDIELKTIYRTYANLEAFEDDIYGLR